MWGWSEARRPSRPCSYWLVHDRGPFQFLRHYDLTDRVIPAEVLEMESPERTKPRWKCWHRRSLPRSRNRRRSGRLLPARGASGTHSPASARGQGGFGRGRGGGLGRSRLHGSGGGGAPPGRRFRPRFSVRFPGLVPPAAGAHLRIPLSDRDLRLPTRGSTATTYCPTVGRDLVARVDLKADRDRGRLRVQGAFAEEGGGSSSVARHLAADLESAAYWLGSTGWKWSTTAIWPVLSLPCSDRAIR